MPQVDVPALVRQVRRTIESREAIDEAAREAAARVRPAEGAPSAPAPTGSPPERR